METLWDSFQYNKGIDMAGVKRWKHPTKITGTQSPHPLYNCWRSIKRRCQIPTDVAWKWYGARGITICKEWNESYDMFSEWAISVGYNIDKETRQIDRIDSNGNYEPSNCRFVDNSTNQANKRVYGKAIYRGISVIASYTRYKITQKSIKNLLAIL